MTRPRAFLAGVLAGLLLKRLIVAFLRAYEEECLDVRYWPNRNP